MKYVRTANPQEYDEASGRDVALLKNDSGWTLYYGSLSAVTRVKHSLLLTAGYRLRKPLHKTFVGIMLITPKHGYWLSNKRKKPYFFFMHR